METQEAEASAGIGYFLVFLRDFDSHKQDPQDSRPVLARGPSRQLPERLTGSQQPGSKLVLLIILSAISADQFPHLCLSLYAEDIGPRHPRTHVQPNASLGTTGHLVTANDMPAGAITVTGGAEVGWKVRLYAAHAGPRVTSGVCENQREVVLFVVAHFGPLD
ncbi:hypothetical protein ACOMHN_051062 [Nucella lapillus]